VKLHYYPETDSLYIELKSQPGTEVREVADGLSVRLRTSRIIRIGYPGALNSLNLL